MPVRHSASIVVAAVAGLVAGPVAQEHHHRAGEKLGTVHFDTSCNPAAQSQFDRAMALLHSFEFGQAADGFGAALSADPRCAMAHWGIALARWGNPFAAAPRTSSQLEQGQRSILAAQQAAPATERERLYIAAASDLYAEFEKTEQRTRVVAYEKDMRALAARYPDDREASIFWALSLAASALPTDKTYANQLQAGAVLEKIYAEQPDHPGVAHYIIHSYDSPELAERALEAAHRYSEIAPSAPHALHMPSHTFTRLGDWQASIQSNLASVAAAKRAGSVAEELHAMDYLVYAYLQTGQDAAVRRILKQVPDLSARFETRPGVGAAPPMAGWFALDAIRVRWVLERRNWPEAAALKSEPAGPAVSRFPQTTAMIYFAKALGAARTQALTEARQSIAMLDEIRDRLSKSKEAYWVEQVEIQKLGASAYLAMAEGRAEESLELMQVAAKREEATDKDAITPGPIAPARELLGDLLLSMNRPAAALEAYQTTLRREPNRFRAIHGAAKAAALAGDRTAASTYYRQLLALCDQGDKPGRPELTEARRYAGVNVRQPAPGR